MKIRVRSMFVSLFSAAPFVLNLQTTTVQAQTTAFSYQGQLASNGVAVSGTYNLTFSLYNAASGGSAVAGPVVTNGVAVNNGLFFVTIDFGSGVWNGQTNWLQIGVQTNGAASFTTLAPRQEVLPAPYAIFANSASNLLGTLPATQLSGAILLSQLPGMVVTNNETANVTLDNLTLIGMLNLPATPVTITAGGSPLLHVDNNENSFFGDAGNLTMSGGVNTANGYFSLHNNTSGGNNAANGAFALFANTSGGGNTADGYNALAFNTGGSANVANGAFALVFNTSGNNNTADGYDTLSSLTSGANNIALGNSAGEAFTGNESFNIDIGNNGVAGESGIIRIGTPGVQTATYLAGNLTLNGTLNLPAAPVSINSGGNLLLRADTNLNFFSGLYAGNGTTSGDYNTANGAWALEGNTSGSGNTASGFQALMSNGTGFGNTVDGAFALIGNPGGNDNTAVGYGTLHFLAGGSENIALGRGAGADFTGNESTNIDIGNGGVAGDSGVIRIGTPGMQTAAYIAGEIFGNGGGLTNISGSQFGPITLAQLPAAVVTNNESASVTLDNLTLNGTLNLPTFQEGVPVTIYSGSDRLLYADDLFNFFAGRNAGNPTSSAYYNTAIGDSALAANTNGYNDTAIGDEALLSNTSGYRNTADGAGALYANTTGNDNTATGVSALAENINGSGNTADGWGALVNNTSGSANTANGIAALLGNQTGSNNTANGAWALEESYSGSDNTADGVGALLYDTSGSDNTAVGCYALSDLGMAFPLPSGTNNIALGYEAGYAFTNNESYNIDIGNMGVGGESGVIRIGTPGVQIAAYLAGSLTLNGTLNLPATPVTINSGGNSLLYADGLFNFFAGPNAGNLTTHGSANTALGYETLEFNASGNQNTANGFEGLNSNRTGNGNTANGFEALFTNTNGSGNTANGASALLFNKSGNNNTADGYGALRGLGSSSGTGGTNNIALGYNAGNAYSGNESSNIDIGNTGVAGENYIIRIGTPGIQTATYLSGTVYANGVALSSDRNAKEHFAAVNPLAVLDKVVALPVSKWNYKSDKEAEHIGPMAQDFHAAFGLDGADDKHISVVDEGGVALAAIQGLNQKVETLSAQNEQLKQENNLLARRLDELEGQVKAESEKPR